MAEALFPVFRYPASLRKHGFHPDEFREIIRSKANEMFRGIENIKEIVDVVIGEFVFQETKDGKGDKRYYGTKEAQQHGSDGYSGTNTSPMKTAQKQPEIIGEWQEDGKNNQDKLFDLMLDENLLTDVINEKGNLKRTDTYLSAVELCNTLDSVARSLAGTQLHESQRETYSRMEEYCENVLHKRIFIANAYDDDILTNRGYKVYCKHLWMIATFAAVLIGLRILLQKPVQVA